MRGASAKQALTLIPTEMKILIHFPSPAGEATLTPTPLPHCGRGDFV